MRIGIVGTSKYNIDQQEAYDVLCKVLDQVVGKKLKKKKVIEIVTGSGAVPNVAFNIAMERGYLFTYHTPWKGLKPKYRNDPKVFKTIIVGQYFGDDSVEFIKYIDVLIRVGGGKQSHNEVTMFRNTKPNNKVYERDIKWYD